MSEGGLDAPMRHPIAWQDPDFLDPEKIDAELRRVFDICHGCRRCFNLCDSFPRLFDLIDESDTGELDAVSSDDFKPVVDACTLCDMCFMTKCPYVPPHEFDLDFPHLMLRYRAMEFSQGKIAMPHRELAKTDRNGRFAAPVAGLANWGADRRNKLTRPILENLAGIHRDAELPKYHRKLFVKAARESAPEINTDAPAYGRKAVLYATCFVNYNNPEIGVATRAVLARNGVEAEVLHPACCGMPQLEQGDVAEVAERARKVAAELGPWIDKGYDVIALVPSCALMLKFEWPLILPGDPAVEKLSEATHDIAEYVVGIARDEGLADGLSALGGTVAVHLACHARAQNMGPKASEMLKLLPGTEIKVIERCSGHGGSWGIMKDTFEVALKVGRPVARQAGDSGADYIVSECPLAREHILQGMERLDADDPKLPAPFQHPIQLMALAYGLAGDKE
jgi:glycerol-3-phosphate dehydrogenase subunit C